MKGTPWLLPKSAARQGKITIPLEVCRKLGLTPGDRIDFVLEKSGEVLLKAGKLTLEDLFAILQGAAKRPLSVKQMNDAVLEAADEDWARLRSQKD